MASTTPSFAQLTDDALVAAVKQLAATERCATAALLRSLIELDDRRLYLREGYSSLFTYCTQALPLAEGAAYNRIEAARAARRFPTILSAVEAGAVTLTTVRLLAPYLTDTNHADLLASARHKAKREVEVLVASLRPRPPVPSTIRKLPEPRAVLADSNDTAAMPVPAASAQALLQPVRVAPRPAVTPLTPERYRLQFTISRETHEMLRPCAGPGASPVCGGRGAACAARPERAHPPCAGIRQT